MHTRQASLLLASLTILSLAVVANAAAEGSHGQSKPSSKQKPVGLVKEVIEGTKRYRDVLVAEAEGWETTVNCVSDGHGGGAMGVHWLNFGLLFDNAALDPQQPEALLYEVKNGRRKLVGVEFIVIAEEWDAAHPDGAAPALMGQLFDYIGAPNRYRLPAVYALHVWAFKDNPHGAYAHWNPKVTCERYEG